MTDCFCIGVDWGTTNLRAYRIDGDGRVLDVRSAAEGILSVTDQAWEDALYRLVGDWLDADPDAILVLSGMIGSRGGWVEVPYVQTPASTDAIATGCIARTLSDGRVAWFAPGLSTLDEAGVSDVMRGEEVQILGAAPANSELGGDRVICLPGTHSKWARVTDGVVTRFATYFTGEMFDLIVRQSIIGKLVVEAPFSDEAFLNGVRRARSGGHLLHQLFGARAGIVAGREDPALLRSFLSGLIIGHEVAAGLREDPVDSVTLLGSETLNGLYRAALAEHGVQALVGDAHVAATGQYRIATTLQTAGAVA